MSTRSPSQNKITPSFTPINTRLLQRQCAACGQQKTGGCNECDKKRLLQRRLADQSAPSEAPPIVHEVLRSPGQPLDRETRSFMESRFQHDFSQVRVHTNTKAAESTQAVNALAYTQGKNIVFAPHQYAPQTLSGRELLAHELTHVIQQQSQVNQLSPKLRVGKPDDSSEREADNFAKWVVGGELTQPPTSRTTTATNWLQRACLSAAACAAPIGGSAEQFGQREENIEARSRARRGRMAPARARASGHGGHARQLEIFLNGQSPGLLSNIHGIFIDQDLSPGTGALTMPCDELVPPITGATKPCTFVHGSLNQQALAFNTTTDPTIGGISREDWRVQTLQILTHEVQHVIFDSTARATPPGVTCSRATVEFELSELNAMMSEFPIAFRAIPAGASATDPARVRLNNWFQTVITNPSESISGALKALRCKCNCADVDAFVIDTFNFVAASWTPAEKTAFNTELQNPRWAAFDLRWPL
ncbi:hypothetical protein Cal7507_3729 [Calothrix sp. PCC 7507]|nr:hypothetical protein Cal7507_3729 [Calothrix sp. PCC 7507]